MEALIVFLVSVLATVLMWTTFYARDGRLNIGVSVFSDFSPHIGMIRSFSYGNNFPPRIPIMPGGHQVPFHVPVPCREPGVFRIKN